MSVNRFARRQVYDQFNPLSIQELSMVPLVKQQQHDAQMAAALQQKAAANALLKDQEDADNLIADVDNRINSFTGDLMNKGVQRNSTKNLLELKQYRDQLMSPDGALGKINANAAAYQAYYKDQKDRFEKGQITRDQFERAVQSSMKEYQGYKNGSFQGYTPSKYVDINKKVTDFSEKIKHDVYTREGYRPLGIDPTTGKSMWEKNGHTTSDVPPGTDQLILNYIQTDEEIKAQLRDDVHFTKTLGLYNTDEMGNVVVGDKYYNPENPEGAAEAMANERVMQAARIGYSVASSGKKDIRTKDRQFIGIDDGSGGGKGKFNANGVGLGEDPGTTSQYNNMGLADLDKKIATTTNKAEKSRLTAYRNKAIEAFKQTPEGKALDNNYKTGKYKTSQQKLDEISATAKKWQSSSGADMYENNSKNIQEYIASNKQFLKDKYNYTDAELNEAMRYSKNQDSFIEAQDKFISEGIVAESKRYVINTFDEDSRNNLNSNFKNSFSDENYKIVGQTDDGTIPTILDMKASKDFTVEAINTYGEYAKPTFTVRYTDDKGKLQIVEVEPVGVRKGKIANSTEHFIDYLAVEDPDLAAEFKGNIAYHNTAIGQDSNLAQEFEVSPYFNNIQVLRSNNGTYKSTITHKDGTIETISYVNEEGKKVPVEFDSKTQALNYVNSYLESEPVQNYMKLIDKKMEGAQTVPYTRPYTGTW